MPSAPAADTISEDCVKVLLLGIQAQFGMPHALSRMTSGRRVTALRIRCFFADNWKGVRAMLKLALTFLALGLVAAFLGFTGLAGAAIPVAKFFAVLFGLLCLGFLLIGMTGPRVAI